MTARKDTLIKYVLTLRDSLPARDKAKMKQFVFSQDPKVECFNYWSFRITGNIDDDYWRARITGSPAEVPTTGEWALEFHDRGGYRTGFICKQKRMDTGEWITTSDIDYTRHFVKWIHKRIRSLWLEK